MPNLLALLEYWAASPARATHKHSFVSFIRIDTEPRLAAFSER
jgi:hypothetical protein